MSYKTEWRILVTCIILCVLAIIVFGLLLTCAGCEQRLTKQEWYDKYVPADINEARAMAIMVDAEAKAEAKLKTIKTMNAVKTWCVIGIMGSVVAIAIGLALRIRLAALLGGIGLLACFAGYGLAHAEIVYSKYIAVVGSIFSVGVLSIVIFIVCRALIQIVKGGEWFKQAAKNNLDDEAVKFFKCSQESAQNPSATKKSATEKIVDGIKKKIL